jgi:hypothetical protein
MFVTEKRTVAEDHENFAEANSSSPVPTVSVGTREKIPPNPPAL